MYEIMLMRRKGSLNGPMSTGRFFATIASAAVFFGIIFLIKKKFPDLSDETMKKIIIGAVMVLALIAIAVSRAMP